MYMWLSSVISEAAKYKDDKTAHTIVEYMQDPTVGLMFLGVIIILGGIILISHIVYKSAMRKPYERVVRDYLRIAEKMKLDKERKEELMQLLEKARTDEDLLNQLRERLIYIRFEGWHRLEYDF